MAGFGAFIAGNKEIIRYLKFNLRSNFRKIIDDANGNWRFKRLELLRTRPEIKAKLWENVENYKNGLLERGFNLWKF